MFELLMKKKKVIGIDIGTNSIKIAELEISRKGAKLLNFGLAPTPANALIGGEIAEAEILGQSIASLVARLQTKRKFAVVGVWGASVIVKKINMPVIESSLLAEQVKWEAEQYIPVELDQINLQYHVLPNRSKENLEVLLVAAKKDHIFKFAESIMAAGLTLSTVDVSGFALANCFEFNYGKRTGETIVLLNIGASVSNFVVIENGEITACRDIPVGGITYTNEIHKDLGVNLEEAEALKISAEKDQEIPQELMNIINNTHETICEEVQGALDIFGTVSAETPISRIYVSGGCAHFANLIDLIGKTTNLAIEPMDPFRRITVDLKKFNHNQLERIRLYAPLALGLAMRST